MEISEAFDLLENELAEIEMVDAWGNPQEPSWAFALFQKWAGEDSEILDTALSRGMITAEDYYENMLPIVRRFRVDYRAVQIKKAPPKSRGWKSTIPHPLHGPRLRPGNPRLGVVVG